MQPRHTSHQHKKSWVQRYGALIGLVMTLLIMWTTYCVMCHVKNWLVASTSRRAGVDQTFATMTYITWHAIVLKRACPLGYTSTFREQTAASCRDSSFMMQLIEWFPFDPCCNITESDGIEHFHGYIASHDQDHIFIRYGMLASVTVFVGCYLNAYFTNRALHRKMKHACHEYSLARRQSDSGIADEVMRHGITSPHAGCFQAVGSCFVGEETMLFVATKDGATPKLFPWWGRIIGAPLALLVVLCLGSNGHAIADNPEDVVFPDEKPLLHDTCRCTFGQSYSFGSIFSWLFASQHAQCPVCRQPIRMTSLMRIGTLLLGQLPDILYKANQYFDTDDMKKHVAEHSKKDLYQTRISDYFTPVPRIQNVRARIE